jgi:transposase
MRYELTDYEWAAIKPFLPNKPRVVPRVNEPSRATTASFGSCVRVRRGAICRRSTVPARPATIASFVGVGQVYGTGSWMRFPLVPMRRYK